MWEPGAQHTCVIITSVQAACHIWHRGAEKCRGAEEKTKRVFVFIFFFLFAKIGPARMTSTLRCSTEGRLGFFLCPPAVVTRAREAEVAAAVLVQANAAKSCDCRSLKLLLKIMPSEFSQDGLKTFPLTFFISHGPRPAEASLVNVV